jgi:DUF1680 family protein
MRNAWYGIAIALLAGVAYAGPTTGLTPIGFHEVQIDSEFWNPRLRTNAQATVPHSLEMCKSRIRSFALAAGVDKGEFEGHIFHDSDVYKVLEGVAYSLMTNPDQKLEARLDKIIELIAGAQEPDGYLNTWFSVKAPEERWTDLAHAHELYCAGHMFEAAVAHYRATGKRTFLDVARRFADHIDSVFGPGKRHGVPGHQEIELALVKLWRATAEERYLKLARFFVEERGAGTHKSLGDYCQDHVPIREQTEPRGHAVRFGYLYSGVADLAAIDRNQGYVDTMASLWQNVADKYTYVTGGVGVRDFREGFAEAHYLPNFKAYCETCASIAMVFWNQRLSLLHGHGRYSDMVERLLYNGALAGVSLDGKKFFYTNPLMSRGKHRRQPWFGLCCCPTNVVRYIAALGDYIYAGLPEGEGVAVLQYVGGSVVVQLAQGSVKITQQTRYPWDGKVRLVVEPDGAGEFTLQARIPGWSSRHGTPWSIRISGSSEHPTVADGFVSLTRVWKKGDTIDLDFEMPVQRIKPHPKNRRNTGRVALQRGPIVYCVEGADNPGPVDTLAVPVDAPLKATFEPNFLGGVVTLRGSGAQRHRFETQDGFAPENRPVDVTAVPYYAWDNREAGTMAVWIRTELPAASEVATENLALVAKPSASHYHSPSNQRFTVTALNDNELPESSQEHAVPSFAWCGSNRERQWIGYEFETPKTLSKTEVYWYRADHPRKRACGVPKSWQLLWQDGSEWKPVEATSGYGGEEDQFNVVSFQPVTTRALRIEVELPEDISAGVLEWRLPR